MKMLNSGCVYGLDYSAHVLKQYLEDSMSLIIKESGETARWVTEGGFHVMAEEGLLI